MHGHVMAGDFAGVTESVLSHDTAASVAAALSSLDLWALLHLNLRIPIWQLLATIAASVFMLNLLCSGLCRARRPAFLLQRGVHPGARRPMATSFTSRGVRRSGRRMVPIPTKHQSPLEPLGTGATSAVQSTVAAAAVPHRQQQQQHHPWLQQSQPPQQPQRRRIRVAQFNILAAKLGQPRFFPFASETEISWEHRGKLLLQNMVDLDAHILCLEELDKYWVHFRPELEKLGYDSVYVQRPSIHAGTWNGTEKADGCGVFFQRSLWNVVEAKKVNYSDTHDRVALLAALEGTSPDRTPILVVCTHLYWDRKKMLVQLDELRQLDEAVQDMLRLLADRYQWTEAERANPPIPVVVSGDFNNVPGSGVYEYMTHTFLSGAAASADTDTGVMRSAYAPFQACMGGVDSVDAAGGSGEPPYSTVTHRRSCTIDFIFHNPYFRPTALLTPPPEHMMDCSTPVPSARDEHAGLSIDERANVLIEQGIPNAHFGSDHLPIMAELEYVLATPRG